MAFSFQTLRTKQYLIAQAFIVSIGLSTSRGDAAIMDYIKDYRLGINLIQANEAISISYDVADSSGASFCEGNSCTHNLGRGSRGIASEYLNGFGIFIQHPFDRQGFWHFDYDLAFSAIIQQGQLASQQSNEYLKTFEYSTFGLRISPYIQFGITPATIFPDLLITMGPVVNTFVGSVAVNGEKKTAYLIARSELFSGFNPLSYAYFSVEIVVFRFGDGFVSFYSQRSATQSNNTGGEIYPGSKDGMSNFRASLNSNESGFKLLLNWPH